MSTYPFHLFIELGNYDYIFVPFTQTHTCAHILYKIYTFQLEKDYTCGVGGESRLFQDDKPIVTVLLSVQMNLSAVSPAIVKIKASTHKSLTVTNHPPNYHEPCILKLTLA